MNQGSRTGKGTAFMVNRRPEELCPGGDRASVVAKKRSNARGVKGGRKVETLNERMKGNDTVNVQWTQFGEEQKQVRKTFDPSPESIGCPGNGRQRLNEPESSGDASADLLESNHQLESRIQEIWPSGSEGGAKLTLSLPLSQPGFNPGNLHNKRFALKLTRRYLGAPCWKNTRSAGLEVLKGREMWVPDEARTCC